MNPGLTAGAKGSGDWIVLPILLPMMDKSD
jgi:hypothetical protein